MIFQTLFLDYMLTYLTLGIFALSFLFIVFEIYDNALIALAGALLMLLFGILTPQEAIGAVDFDTILLLMAMMIVVHIASKSGIFEWVCTKITALTRGNPLAIFLFFCLLTAVVSSVLDNVTTVVLLVPLTIELLRGMGRDPKPYIFAEIIFANMGGALTLIGDPSNILIGGAAGLNFTQFIVNLWIPILASSIFVIFVFIIRKWSDLKPISKNLADLFVANLIIKKVKNKFVKRTIHKDFVIKVVGVLVLTLLGFIFQTYLKLPTYLIAFVAAIFLSIICFKRINIEETFKSIEWTTMFFFIGLFIMVAGVEKTGILEQLSGWIAGSTSNVFYLSLIVLWATGLISMVINTVPFITLMIPVIVGIQAKFPGIDTQVLWWALSLGACLGGSGTLIGASCNVVAAGISKREGVQISFIEHAKFVMPITVGILLICSVYLFFGYN